MPLAPRRKTELEAAQWVARRLQEGTPHAAVMLELEQDGVPAGEAKATFASVEVALHRHLRPSPRRMALLMAEALVPATALAFVWENRDPLRGVEEPGSAAVSTAFMYGVGFGIVLGFVVAFVAGGRRGARITLIAVAAGWYAIALGSYMTPHHGTQGATFLAFIGSIASSVFVLTRRKPVFDLVREDGGFGWRRSSRQAIPAHEPHTVLVNPGKGAGYPAAARPMDLPGPDTHDHS